MSSQMQGVASDKTFHLKWNNHLQNLSQLFTTIYSSSALADVTLSCRDGTLKAHKLVLSACSPYFEQIFRDNPCQHPIVILKGIPFSEINLLVEFMYKGSVDVQELDLQSLMHTAAELEIRGLAYEARDNAAQMLNVNLEYPTYPAQAPQPPPAAYPQSRTDVERLKQIHMYQQSMMRAEELRRRRRDEPATHTVVNNILAAAAREMEEARAAGRVGAAAQTDADHGAVNTSVDEERGRKRPSILSPDEPGKPKKRPQMTVRFVDDKPEDRKPAAESPQAPKPDLHKSDEKHPGIKVVQLSALQKPAANDHDDDDERKPADDDEDTDSSESVSDAPASDQSDVNARPHVCDICDVRFQRASHLSRHRLTHTGERPFTCGGCGRSFARSDKLRVHTKICERDDPTVDLNSESTSSKQHRENSEVMSGMVRSTHRESGHLVFTPSGDVMLPPRAAAAAAASSTPVLLNATLESPRDPRDGGLMEDPPRRGRGRPRKTPLPLTPKIKKKRGRPPKTSLDMEGCVLTGGTIVGPSAQALTHLSTPSGQHLLLKRKRGRPPKNYFMSPDGRPNENYNASNLPFGDFSYLTDMLYAPPLGYSYAPEPAGPPARTIDVSDSETTDDEKDPEEHGGGGGGGGGGAEIMTVGDCQIVKIPSPEAKDEREQQKEETVTSSTPNSVTITPITTVGDCTIRPVENA